MGARQAKSQSPLTFCVDHSIYVYHLYSRFIYLYCSWRKSNTYLEAGDRMHGLA